MTIASAPAQAQLEELFRLKYGDSGQLNWSPALRRKFNYFNPDDVYECLMQQLVTGNTRWLDVGCGRNVFPSNAKLARILADRCKLLVGVDPDETLNDNPFVHEKVPAFMDDFRDARQYDLITLRMVAEHVEHPARLLQSLDRAVSDNGLVVIYTVNKYSPVPLVTNLVPFALHNPVKRVLWGTEPEDTFPTCFRMNTRRTLDALFSEHGFREELFLRLDDCRTFSGFKPLATLELVFQKLFRAIGLPYPEHCLLGAYRRSSRPVSA